MLTGCASASSDVVLLEPGTGAPSEEFTSEEAAAVQDTAEEISFAPERETEPENIVVYVCGAVPEPGVYELPGGSRVDDAVKAAGGFSEDADRTYTNLAAVLQDGIKLQIPTTEEVTQLKEQGATPGFETEAGSSTGQDVGKPGLVNINTASMEELKTLPGIGDGIARKIIDYRSENGSFKSIEDIMKVSGIKDKLFSKIRDQITV